MATYPPHHENYPSWTNQTCGNELIGDVLQWTPSYSRAKAGRPAQTYIQQLCADTRCSPEDLPEAIGRGGERGSGISVLMARHDNDNGIRFNSMCVYVGRMDGRECMCVCVTASVYMCLVVSLPWVYKYVCEWPYRGRDKFAWLSLILPCVYKRRCQIIIDQHLKILSSHLLQLLGDLLSVSIFISGLGLPNVRK